MSNLNPQQFTAEQVGQAYSTEYDSPVSGVIPSLLEQDADQGRPDKVERLAASVRRVGIRKPLQLLAPVPGEEPEPMLVDGHHRYAAGVRAGLSSFPVQVHQPVVRDGVPDWPTFQR
jgi:hypothetical protein